MGMNSRQQVKQKRGDVAATVGHSEQMHHRASPAAQERGNGRHPLPRSAHVEIKAGEKLAGKSLEDRSEPIEIKAVHHHGEPLSGWGSPLNDAGFLQINARGWQWIRRSNRRPPGLMTRPTVDQDRCLRITVAQESTPMAEQSQPALVELRTSAIHGGLLPRRQSPNRWDRVGLLRGAPPVGLLKKKLVAAFVVPLFHHTINERRFRPIAATIKARTRFSGCVEQQRDPTKTLRQSPTHPLCCK